MVYTLWGSNSDIALVKNI